MSDERFKKSGPGAPIGPIVERQSGRVHRDASRHQSQSDSELDDEDDFETEDISAVYAGEELKRMRAKRKPLKRLERLEVKTDGLFDKVAKIEVAQAKSHGELSGKLDTLVEFAGASAVEREKRAAADAAELARKETAVAQQRKLDADERERKRKHIAPIIKAIGIALALIAAAIIGHGAK